jgi:serine-type D-Ala-D-Ala carboxypeptidase
LGWELPNRENGLTDVGFSEQAVGVTGFTGCALWLEPNKQLAITLMSNRVHPSRSNRKILGFRQEVLRTILSTFRA